MKKSGEEFVERSMEMENNQEDVDDDFIAWEIMSRLPVKSLMRFKCVSKRWQSSIQKDHFFIDLHLSRSITAARTSFLLVHKPFDRKSDDKMFVLSAELLLPSNEENRCAEVGPICLWEPPIPREHHVSICTLNGLICFMDIDTSCTLVYNSCTRESTPWIKSIIKEHEDENVKETIFPDDEKSITSKLLWKQVSLSLTVIEEELVFLKHEFGYDPATKEHKVIALWQLHRYGSETSVFFWEVMTVGQDSWTRIDGIDPSISPREIKSSVYVNGSIFFLCKHRNNDRLALSIVEFSVGSEKFSLVETIASYHSPRDMLRTELIQVNGRLCVLIYDHTRCFSSKSISIRMLYGIHENFLGNSTSSINTTMSSNKNVGSRNHHWVEDTIKLPRSVDLSYIRNIPGTNLLIMRSADDGFFFYHYSQRTITYNMSKINSEISTILKNDNGGLSYRLKFDTFTPNMFPVN